ncbi:MAG: hypothetical protein EOO04_37205, partial [Chitinophagaceae bacterium]
MKHTLTTTIFCLCLAALSLSWKPVAKADKPSAAPAAFGTSATAAGKIHSLYLSLDLQEIGLSEDAFSNACKGYEVLL